MMRASSFLRRSPLLLLAIALVALAGFFAQEAPPAMAQTPVVSFQDTDLATAISGSATAALEGTDTSVTVTLAISPALTFSNRVRVRVLDGDPDHTAEPDDYIVPESVVLPAGATTTTFVLQIPDDDIGEYQDTVVIGLEAVDNPPYALGTDRSATLRITDNDPVTVSFLPTDATYTRGTGGTEVTYSEYYEIEEGKAATLKMVIERPAEYPIYVMLTGAEDSWMDTSNATGDDYSLTPHPWRTSYPVPGTQPPLLWRFAEKPVYAPHRSSPTNNKALAYFPPGRLEPEFPGPYLIIHRNWSINGYDDNETDEFFLVGMRLVHPLAASGASVLIGPDRAVVKIIEGTCAGCQQGWTEGVVPDPEQGEGDTAGLTVSAGSQLAVAEGGAATYTVVLDSQPTADVTVAATSGDTDKARVSPTSHTFTPSAWNTPLTFTVSGVADTDTNDESVAISHAVTSDDAQYAAVLLYWLAVSVSDTTAPGQRVACGSQPQQQTPQEEYADLIAEIYEWRNDPQWSSYKSHTDRWDRVLLAYGETVADTTLTAMTADEAQQWADEGWEPWIRTVAALRELENRAPTVASAIADATMVNESGKKTVGLAGVFSDADNDNLTITACSSDATKATVSVAADYSSLTVAAKSRGAATIRVTADDGNGGAVQDAFSVTVRAAPVVASALADLSLDVQKSRVVSLAGVFSDADGDTLTVTAASSDDEVVYAFVFEGELSVLAAAEGTARITVTAEDADGNSVSDAFDVAVTAPQQQQQQQQTPNQVPTVSAAIADATIVSESDTQTVSLSGVFSDADGDSLTITAASSDDAKATVSVASDQSGLTVTAKSRGTTTITVTADDGRGGTVEDSFTVRVKAAPVVASALANVSGLEVDATRDVSLSGVFSDADGDSLTITAASSDDARATVSVASDGSSLTLAGVAEGTATITVTARDSDGNTVSDTFEVSVEPEPEDDPTADGETSGGAPVVVSPLSDVSLEGGEYRELSLSGVFTDPDGDDLRFTVASSNYPVATGWEDGLTLTVVATGTGTAIITVTAEDPDGNKVGAAFEVTVRPSS